MSIVNEIKSAIKTMSKYCHNSQDWDDETYQFINPVFDKVTQLEQRLKDAEEVIAFYASTNNWKYPGNDFHNFAIAREDTSAAEWVAKSGRILIDVFGGKRARAYQKKYSEGK